MSMEDDVCKRSLHMGRVTGTPRLYNVSRLPGNLTRLGADMAKECITEAINMKVFPKATCCGGYIPQNIPQRVVEFLTSSLIKSNDYHGFIYFVYTVYA